LKKELGGSPRGRNNGTKSRKCRTGKGINSIVTVLDFMKHCDAVLL